MNIDKIRQMINDILNYRSVKKELEECRASKVLISEQLFSCSQEKNDYSKELEKLKLQNHNEYEEYWNKKRPFANISYSGRVIPILNEKVECDVRVFITPFDFIIQNDIRLNKLKVTNPFRCNDDIIKIYRHTRTKSINPYKYAYD